jgi:CSLREA domain-containing protein
MIFATTSWWATIQRASNQSRESQRSHASLFQSDTGVRPEGATITVNSTSDINLPNDGLCTLREAILAANVNSPSGPVAGECAAGSSSGPDTINVAVTGTISLTGILPDITSDMSLIGPGSSQLTIKRNSGGNYRLFNITSGTVSISGVTVRDGRTPDASAVFNPPGPGPFNGGGIQNLGALTLTDVTVTANIAGQGINGGPRTQGSSGGGIANSGTLTVVNSTISANTAGGGGTDGGVNGMPGGDGGGIYNTGTLTVTNSIVSGNSSGTGGSNDGSVCGRGAGIYSNGTLIVNQNTQIINNQASLPGLNETGGDGGGIYASGNSVAITDSTISGNVTHTPPNLSGGSNGAGIYSTLPLTITRSKISDNTTNNSGAVSGGVGAGIAGGQITLINSTVSGNSTFGRGGGVNVGGTLTLIGSTIGGNTGAKGSGVFGGEVIATNSTISGNQPNAGISANHMILTNCTLTANGGAGADNPGNPPASSLRNTIASGNSTDTGDVVGMWGSYGHNFIGINPGNPSFINGVNGDQVGTPATPLNAHLGPLADNGGPTKTHALLPNSTALDAGDNCVTEVTHCGDANFPPLTTDQRGTGFSRLVDGPDADTTATVDVGAYETQVTLANLADTSTNEDTQLAVPFDAGDTSTISSITLTSSNNTLVPNDVAHLSGAVTGANVVITINPAPNQNGTTNISVTVNRTGGGTENKTFMLTVNPVNDAPSFVKGADVLVNEDAGLQVIPNWATAVSPGPTDEVGQTLSFVITNNSNSGLFGAGLGIDPSGTLHFTPADNTSGSATITLVLTDNGGTANGGSDTSAAQTFTITVNPVNDPPSFTRGPDQTVNEDGGAQTVANWATSISAGPFETGQTVAFQVTNNSNPGLFSAAPAVGPTGTLTYTPAPNANGSATVSVVLKDNGGTANGGVDTSAAQTFVITVNAVNDAPSFTKGANQTVNEDAGAQTINNWATAISAGPADESSQTLTFQIVSNTNPTLFSAVPTISSTGTLTYTPAADANGSATIAVNLKDNGGTANGGVDTSTSQSFTITVNAVNDAPSFTRGANQTVNNNAGPQTVVNWATGISPGPANESGQTVTFQVTGNTNAGLFTTGPAISSTGTLSYTPSTSAGGTATITIVARDNGGTANGGVDTSAAQSFTITVNPAGGFISFASSSSNTTENSGSTTVTVTRTGDTVLPATVKYATNGDSGLPCSQFTGVASPKCDFTAASGTLNFSVGETSKTITILISQDSFVEGPEVITVTLSSPTGGAALGTPASTAITIIDDVLEPPTNVIDDANTFVRMHYHDFLNREADQSGLNFWIGQMTNCGSADLTVCRVNVSGSFFQSIEFQQTGYLVERMYKTAYGDATGTSTLGGAHSIFVPVVRANEFLADTQRVGQGVVVLQPGWEQVLENNKQAYAKEFVATTRFTTAFPTTMTPAQFVDKLNQNAGNVLSQSERTTALNLFGNSADTTNVTARAQALRQVAEDQDLFNAESNRAFVLAQYFGYLRRNPNDLPDSDYTGYDFWLQKLIQFNGDYVAAEMVKAFISAGEYRQRFGP